MTYETLRQLADSWGLVATMLLFVTLIGWTFLPRASAAHARAAVMILEDDRLEEGEQANG